ncbi:glycosyltransferase [Flavobacterium sp. JLP]|uniref:glycosyltransferase n=1 Tax=Flavobacterium sp. JLP TaxID=2783793 RepID=UPI00188B7D3A|nr:glycosyltransferase [Flavobacterium sp. JLP]MBF4507115.1 glycosyltransferase [Flavobacterium sp. JLP]
MKLLIVSTAPFVYRDNHPYAYSPYVNELIILEKFVDEIIFCCPVWEKDNGLLITKIPFSVSLHFKLKDFNVKSFFNLFKSFFYCFYNIYGLFKAMKAADHIHLRCPGNIGLLGCLVQIVFPNKAKTAKYAGNWDPDANQPLSYRMQKWILNNTFLTRNMQVLVYGNWENSTKNIKAFFTATYSDNEKLTLNLLNLKQKIHFVFVGTLTAGKNPLYAIRLIEGLIKKGYDVKLDLYGEGIERDNLENYILEKKLSDCVFLNGNQSKEVIKNAYQKSHFVILPSKSEGWPKVIAEGMFWGSIPIATKVSCVPFMLDFGKRGILLEMNLDRDLAQIHEIIKDENIFNTKRELAYEWSQQYTTEVFEAEIKKLLLK